MTDPLALYRSARTRMLQLTTEAGAAARRVTVPACPDWSAHDLIAHCVSMPAAIAAGDLPGDDLDGWLDAIRAARADHSIEELAAEWESVDDTIAAMVSGGGGVLLDDLVVHEHDLRGALGRPDHSVLDGDVFVPRALQSCVPELERRGLGAIEVRHTTVTWRSHDAPTGWVLEVSPWEAVRVLYSRRTEDELRTLGDGPHVDDYVRLLDDHLPLPVTSLDELGE
jgi:hypothetical protein